MTKMKITITVDSETFPTFKKYLDDGLVNYSTWFNKQMNDYVKMNHELEKELAEMMRGDSL